MRRSDAGPRRAGARCARDMRAGRRAPRAPRRPAGGPPPCGPLRVLGPGFGFWAALGCAVAAPEGRRGTACRRARAALPAAASQSFLRRLGPAHRAWFCQGSCVRALQEPSGLRRFSCESSLWLGGVRDAVISCWRLPWCFARNCGLSCDSVYIDSFLRYTAFGFGSCSCCSLALYALRVMGPGLAGAFLVFGTIGTTTVRHFELKGETHEAVPL